MKKHKVILTDDGSHTLLSEEYGVGYHSLHGALEESVHIFISAGIYYLFSLGKKNIDVFEMGYGTGLNAWLTYIESSQLGLDINYSGIEISPVNKTVIDQLNFTDLFKISNSDRNVFYQMHKLPWGEKHQIGQNFRFTKNQGNIFDFDFENDSIDVIYFDAFAPSSQAELWESTLHARLYSALRSKGCLVTYCAKGVFKRMLKELGYKIDVLNGPGRKHEMTRAIKV